MMTASFACIAIISALTTLSVTDNPLPSPKNGGIYVVAHRGAHEGIPENSLPAYQKAIDLGADFVEIDVRSTKDGKFVSVHNSEIDGYAEGAKGKVKDLTFDELRSLDIGSRVGPQWKGTRIPTFEEILDLCKGKIGIYLDLKDAPIEKLAPLIKARGMERNIIWYIGPEQVSALHEASSDFIEMPDPGSESQLPKLLQSMKPRVVASSVKQFSKSFVDKCHAANAILIIDDGGPDSWEKALKMGVDGLQTDQPEALIRYLNGHSEKK
jgi:glycerophosphoryl diester phosphodiesterase